MAKNDFIVVVLLLFVSSAFGAACTPAETNVTSGTPVSGTTVAGSVYYHYAVPDTPNPNYIITVIVRETSTTTNSIGLYTRNIFCPDTTTYLLAANSSYAANGYNSMVFASTLITDIYIAVYSETAGINYQFTLTMVPSGSVLTATNNIPYNLFGNSQFSFSTTQTGAWTANYRYTSGTVTASSSSTKSFSSSANTTVLFDSCSSFAASTNTFTAIGNLATTKEPSGGFTLTTATATTYTAAVNASSLTGQTLAAGASVTYLFTNSLANTIIAAIVTETSATTDNLVVYWATEACATSGNNFFTHGSSTGGRYFSYLNPSTKGPYSLTLYNNGGSSSTFNIQLYQNANYFTVPTGYDVHGYLGGYNSITFAASGASQRLQFLVRGYYCYMYASGSGHPGTSSGTYDFYNSTSISSSTYNRTVVIDGCGTTPGRNELLVYNGLSSSTTFVMSATDLTGSTLSVSQLTSGTDATGIASSTAAYYYISTTVGNNLKVTLVDGDQAGVTLNVYAVCPSSNPTAIRTLSATTYYLVAATSRVFFSVTSTTPGGYSLKVEAADEFALSAGVTVSGYAANIGDTFYFSYSSPSGFYFYQSNSGFNLYAKNGTKFTSVSEAAYSGTYSMTTSSCYSSGPSTWHFMAVAYNTGAQLSAYAITAGVDTLVSGTNKTAVINSNYMALYAVSTTVGKTLTFQITPLTASYNWHFRTYSYSCPSSYSYYDVSYSTYGSTPLTVQYGPSASNFYAFIYDSSTSDTFTLAYTESDAYALTEGVDAYAVVATGSWVYYTFQSTGQFSITFSGYNKYVYARYGAKPTQTSYSLADTTTYSSGSRYLNTDSCSGGQAGLWYIGVYSYSSSSYYTATINVVNTGGSSQTLTTLSATPSSVTDSSISYFTYTPSSDSIVTVSLTPSGYTGDNYAIYASSGGCPSSSTYKYYAPTSYQLAGNKASISHLASSGTPYYYAVYSTATSSYSISASTVSQTSGISLNSGNTVVGSLQYGEYVYFAVDALTSSFNIEVTGSSVYFYISKGTLPTQSSYLTSTYGSSIAYNTTINGCVTSQTIPGRWYIGAYTYSTTSVFTIKAYLTGAPTCNYQTTSVYTGYTTYTGSYTTATTSIGTGGQAATCSYSEGSQCTSTYVDCVNGATANGTVCGCISDWGYCLVSVFCGNGTASDFDSFYSACQSYGCSEEQCNPILNSRYSGAAQLYVNNVLVAVLVAALVALFKF